MRSILSRVLRFHLPIWLVMPMLALTFALGLGGGYLGALELTSPCPLDRQTCASFQNFWRVWTLASDHYVDPAAVNPTKMVDGAIEGMLDSLGDRAHTRYLSPENARAWRESLSGRFEGIGAYIDVRNDQPIIIEPIENSPAERAGLRPGDLILKVDGKDVYGVTVEELRTLVRGPKGTNVVLTVRHVEESLPIDITVVREEINLPSVTWRMLPNNIALINLNQFSERSSEEMKQALIDAKAQGAAAIVLDLRNNSGGLVYELVEIAGEFLPPDTTVLLEQDRSGQRQPYKTREAGVATTIPLVLLVNNNTASAAEILAGAMKDTGRARVIGMPTFGTATVLRPFELDDGAQVYIGTTQWLTPKGEIVRGKGINPDELVPLAPNKAPLSPSEAARLSEQELLQSDDVQLVRALDAIKEIVAQR